MTPTTPLYATVLQKDYNRLKDKLDACQKECIRIAELYRTNRNQCNLEIEKIIARIDSDPDYTKVLGDLSVQNQQLLSENAQLQNRLELVTAALEVRDTRIAQLSDKVYELEKSVEALQRIPSTDNSAVIEFLQDENAQLTACLDSKT